MGHYQHSHSPADWSASGVADFDRLLAGAGYRVRSSDPQHLAQGLEQLDSAAAGADDCESSPPLIPCDTVHYNHPSDLTAWVDSILSDLTSAALPHPPHPPPATWIATVYSPGIHCTLEDQEDAGIRLIHLLMASATAVHRGDAGLASALIDDTRHLLTCVSNAFGMGKVAGYFADALYLRIFSPQSAAVLSSPAVDDILYHNFYEACPYLKFAHFTANQAILEAFDGEDRVHVIDFNLMHGLQWPALIQALALRPGGPPALRITGVGPPYPDGRDNLREVGLQLANLAQSVKVRFAFRGVAAARLSDVRPWMLQVAVGEAVAVNSIFQFHRLLGDPDEAAPAPIDSVLSWVAGLRPKILTVVEQEADHNRPGFLDRFTEALFYYSTLFDSLEAGGAGVSGDAAVAEVYLQREMCNVVCCEGSARVERHEPLARWAVRLGRAGLKPVHLGSSAFKQANMLLSLFSGEGYCVEEVDGCLTLGWHSRPLISASSWCSGDHVPSPETMTTSCILAGSNVINVKSDEVNYVSGSAV
ncbi:DELLA protein GAI [Apostasia shenzhenica]|uniref:DELLA protein n=1 Tax=Apostasia shenzhenica TaxID=1088818 RepID=A0A2I0A7T6_9ASPA|nr:DELLA protein GAI [Apostasia shenzhenica]